MLVNILKGGIEKFEKYQDKILDIYFEIFSSGIMEQYLDRDSVIKYISDLFEANGYGYFILDGKKLIGFLLSCPLQYITELPDSINERFSVDKSYYMAEMHISKEYRGKGIGTQVIKLFLDDIDRRKWNNLFCRAWVRNKGAIKLYQRFGFQLDEIISLKRMKKDKSGTFMTHRQYLWRKL